jgi:hypothetical protein
MPEDDEDERFDRLLEALETAVELCTRPERLQRVPDIARSCAAALAVANELLDA